jgi:hypothetical protein
MAFWKKAMPMVLFYIIGDYFTTVYAVSNGLGAEGNPIVSGTFDSGYLPLASMKLAYLLFSYMMFNILKEKEWSVANNLVAFIGLGLCINNCWIILYP